MPDFGQDRDADRQLSRPAFLQSVPSGPNAPHMIQKSISTVCCRLFGKQNLSQSPIDGANHVQVRFKGTASHSTCTTNSGNREKASRSSSPAGFGRLSKQAVTRQVGPSRSSKLCCSSQNPAYYRLLLQSACLSDQSYSHPQASSFKQIQS